MQRKIIFELFPLCIRTNGKSGLLDAECTQSPQRVWQKSHQDFLATLCPIMMEACFVPRFVAGPPVNVR